MTSQNARLSTILDREAVGADGTSMRSNRTHSLYTSIVAGCGMVLSLGAFLVTDATSTRAIFAGIFFALLTGGIYVLMLLRRTNVLSSENELLRELNAGAIDREGSLRTQLQYTLREPLAEAVGKADQLMSSPTMPYDDRRAFLASIRDNAREVEQALETLATQGSPGTVATPQISSVVLLDEELRSIGKASPNSNRYDFDIEQARAWGDPASVRQILRTLINISTHAEGGQLTLQTAQRGSTATATVSGKGAILPMAARAALSEDSEPVNSGDGAFEAARAAVNLAATMGGSISHVHAFGISHVLLTLPAQALQSQASSGYPRSSEQRNRSSDAKADTGRMDSNAAVHSPS